MTNLRHGYASRAETGKVSSTYNIWSGARGRCTNKRSAAYQKYGAKGIRMCARWVSGEGGKSGFQCFVEDMGERPTSKHSLDRIDSKGNYEPSNCRWATDRQQQNNRSNNIMITAFGETDTVANWARRNNVSRIAILNRIAAGWNVERALTQPVRKMTKRVNH